MLAQMVANKNGGTAAPGNGRFGIIGKLLGDHIAEKSITAKRAADVDELCRSAARFQMGGGAKRLRPAVSVVDHERQGAEQKTGCGESEVTASHHFRQFASKNGHYGTNQT